MFPLHLEAKQARYVSPKRQSALTKGGECGGGDGDLGSQVPFYALIQLPREEPLGFPQVRAAEVNECL